MNVLDFQRKKLLREKISMVTCYDYTSATILENTPVDCLLVGDSLAMTIYGFRDTLSASLAMMALHTAGVSRGAPQKFIVSDLPFLSYRKSLSKSVSAVQQLIQAGANAVKLEGANGNLKLIKHLVESGIPVMGHLGLTPQSLHALGGYKVQGKTEESIQRLQEEARALEASGVFAIVLECIPSALAGNLSRSLAIPTIGIGAGPLTDGQVLVWQDALGLNQSFKPKFVKHFAEGFNYLKFGIENYITAIKSGEFPQDEHCYQAE